jgi:arabinan endo-1,5-alpha-L-arabinosidase
MFKPIFRALALGALLVMVLSFGGLAVSDASRLVKDIATANPPTEPPGERLYDFSLLGRPDAWGNLNVHDPAVYRDGDTYYVFSTDASLADVARPGIQVRKSRDLIHWSWIGQALGGVPRKAREWTGATGLWAPDVTRIGAHYYLYYSASTFGKNRSFIGVARSKRLTGPWEDLGEVLKTDIGDRVNAIDPNVVYDSVGDLWLAYGSFWSGIHIVRLDQKTGKPLEKGFGKLLASRSLSVHGAIEGAYLIYHPGYKKYYLFVSYDSLFKDYNVRVGRSDRIDGPYVDANGVALTDTRTEPATVGNKILGGYRFGNADGWIAPGHNSVLQDGEEYYLLHHARGDRDKNWFYLQVRKMLWSRDGWPLLSPERYAGEREQDIAKERIAGVWEVIVLAKDDNLQLSSAPLRLSADGRIDGAAAKGSWEFAPDNTLILHLQDSNTGQVSTYECRVLPAWDWEERRRTLVFTGIDPQGIAIWGKMTESSSR